MTLPTWTTDDIAEADRYWGPDMQRYWSRDRRRSVDRRTRGYKAWKAHRERLVKDLGRTPTTVESALIDALADRLVDADLNRARRSCGMNVEPAGSEIRRLAVALGLISKGESDERTLEQLMR